MEAMKKGLFIVSLLFMGCCNDNAQFYQNQAKDREYQVQRLQFKIENMKAKPGSLCFFGDSIVLLWPTKEYFPGSYNRGISSQTTEQMLARFKEDVIDLHPKTVVIIGGINDIAHHIPSSETYQNLECMMALARLNKIHPILIETRTILGEHTEYYFDDVHPNLAGYDVMTNYVKTFL